MLESSADILEAVLGFAHDPVEGQAGKAVGQSASSTQARPVPKAGRSPQNKRRPGAHGKRGRHGNPEQKYLAAMAMAQL